MLRTAFSLIKGVYVPKHFIHHAASLGQAFAHCRKFSTAASRRSMDRHLFHSFLWRRLYLLPSLRTKELASYGSRGFHLHLALARIQSLRGRNNHTIRRFPPAWALRLRIFRIKSRTRAYALSDKLLG